MTDPTDLLIRLRERFLNPEQPPEARGLAVQRELLDARREAAASPGASTAIALEKLALRGLVPDAWAAGGLELDPDFPLTPAGVEAVAMAAEPLQVALEHARHFAELMGPWRGASPLATWVGAVGEGGILQLPRFRYSAPEARGFEGIVDLLGAVTRSLGAERVHRSADQANYTNLVGGLSGSHERPLGYAEAHQQLFVLNLFAQWARCADLGGRLPARDVSAAVGPAGAALADVPNPFAPLVDVLLLGFGWYLTAAPRGRAALVVLVPEAGLTRLLHGGRRPGA